MSDNRNDRAAEIKRPEPIDMTIDEWIKAYRDSTGIELNAGTVRKRRLIADIGRLVPPRTYLLTKEEFIQVLKTPLPMCHQVIQEINF